MKITCAKIAGGPPGAKTVTYIWRSRGRDCNALQALRHDYQASLRSSIIYIWSYLITGLDCGLEWWTGLLDLICSYHMTSIQSNVNLVTSNCLIISCTSSSHCMLGNAHECTVHKLHGRMCTMSSGCTCSEFKHVKAPSDYSKRAKKHQQYWQRPPY